MLNTILNYLDCGMLEKENRSFAYYLSVYKFSDNYDKIMPFFKQNRLVGIKALNFEDWCQIAELIKTKKHLTPTGKDLILTIKSKMDKGRIK